MLNIVVAAKIWAAHWSNKRIRIFSDNMAVIQILTTGKARDQILTTCARNIWLIAALNNIQFQFAHIPSKNNVLADLLSRWNATPNATDKLASLITNYLWVPTHLTLTCLSSPYSTSSVLFQISRARQPSWPPWLLLIYWRDSGLPQLSNIIACGRTSCCIRWWLGCPPVRYIQGRSLLGVYSWGSPGTHNET